MSSTSHDGGSSDSASYCLLLPQKRLKYCTTTPKPFEITFTMWDPQQILSQKLQKKTVPQRDIRKNYFSSTSISMHWHWSKTTFCINNPTLLYQGQMEIYQESPQKFLCKHELLEIILYKIKLLICFKSQIFAISIRRKENNYLVLHSCFIQLRSGITGQSFSPLRLARLCSRFSWKLH